MDSGNIRLMDHSRAMTVLRLASAGFNRAEIGRRIGRSAILVENILSRLRRFHGVKTTKELINLSLKRHVLMNRKYFYDSVRTSLFGGSITQKQFDGMEAILNEWDRRNRTDIRKLAYILATVLHESGHTMQPVEEIGKGEGRAYGQKLDMGGGPGKRVAYTTPNHIFYGRGLVQVTWRCNYEALTRAAMAERKDWDFLNNPELLLIMQPSVWALFYGMESGMFTGKKLADYFSGSMADYYNARKIINGLDQAKRIEAYAKTFFTAMLPPFGTN